MRASDYDAVRSLWMTIKGFAIRSMDDSREGVDKKSHSVSCMRGRVLS